MGVALRTLKQFVGIFRKKLEAEDSPYDFIQLVIQYRLTPASQTKLE